MYCLWLNGKKVYTLRQLKASFDAEAVGLYCLGGGLVRWLKDCGEQEAAEKVEQIDTSESISRQLAEIFNVDLPEEKENLTHRPAVTSTPPTATVSGSFTFPLSSFSDISFSLGSFSTSFNTASINFSTTYSSFFITSFLTTSFGGHEYEYEYESGSFTTNSFSLYLNSFFTASFAFPSGSFTPGSFTSEYGSFSPDAIEIGIETGHSPLTPQQKFELNLSSNPLNRYGYGIHLI